MVWKQFGEKHFVFNSAHVVFRAYLKYPHGDMTKSLENMSLEFREKACVGYVGTHRVERVITAVKMLGVAYDTWRIKRSSERYHRLMSVGRKRSQTRSIWTGRGGYKEREARKENAAQNAGEQSVGWELKSIL